MGNGSCPVNFLFVPSSRVSASNCPNNPAKERPDVFGFSIGGGDSSPEVSDELSSFYNQ